MINLKHIISGSLGAIILSGCITVRAGSFDYQTTENLKLSSEGVELFKIDAGAGFLQLEGVEGISEIRVKADLNVNKDSYKLELERKGSRAVLIAEANDGSFGWNTQSPTIDLTIKVPTWMVTQIEDGSGYIDIKNLSADLKVSDGSGQMTIVDVEGELEIDDGSGSITLENIRGNIDIEDGSGSINIAKASKDITIDDGSGGIDISTVGGKVNVEDGSGGMTLEGIVGHVTIDDGSGGIEVKNLENGLTIINSGSGGLSIKNVKGDINTDE